jgi:hypothetical protein
VGVDAGDALDVLRDHGMLLQSARGPISNVAELVAGEPISGSWWGHPASHAIFETLNALDGSPDVVRLRLVKGKVTFVHRSLWPALVRLADRFPPAALAALDEEHTESGKHRVVETPFPEWVPADATRAAAQLTESDARAQLPDGAVGAGRSAAASASTRKSR